MKESIGFSGELASIYAESIRVIGEICRNGFGLTYSQFAVMKILASSEEGLRADDLAHAAGLKTSSLWLLLLELEDRGLVAKENKESDRRIMRCSLSAEGKKLSRPAIRVCLKPLWAGIGLRFPIVSSSSTQDRP